MICLILADKDNVLSMDEFAKLLKVIDSKITSLPATAQRAASQGNDRKIRSDNVARKVSCNFPE